MFYYSDDIRKSLDVILNKGFCCHTFMRAAKEYNAISNTLLEEDRIALRVLLLEIDPYYPDGSDSYASFADCIKAIKGRRTAQDKIPHEYCSEDMLASIRSNKYLFPLHKVNKQKDFGWYDKYPESFKYTSENMCNRNLDTALVKTPMQMIRSLFKVTV